MSKMIVCEPMECAGCRTCEMACSLVHYGACSPVLSNIRVVEWSRLGLTVPMTCLQCDDPVCMNACKVGAIKRNPETGAMVLSEELCVGCKMCMLVCPVGAPSFHPEFHTMHKCDLCDGDPLCVKVCPTGCLKYVDILDVPGDKRRNGAALLINDTLLKLKNYDTPKNLE